jgi:hypothetical protein
MIGINVSEQYIASIFKVKEARRWRW